MLDGERRNIRDKSVWLNHHSHSSSSLNFYGFYGRFGVNGMGAWPGSTVSSS